MYFEEKIEALINGVRAAAGAAGGAPSIKMGYVLRRGSADPQSIPALDRRFVPAISWGWIVYHEMLHQEHDIPSWRTAAVHTPEFMARSRTTSITSGRATGNAGISDRILNF
jgi:hypothetical protein